LGINTSDKKIGNSKLGTYLRSEPSPIHYQHFSSIGQPFEMDKHEGTASSNTEYKMDSKLAVHYIT
jgi:hypothetical protein